VLDPSGRGSHGIGDSEVDGERNYIASVIILCFNGRRYIDACLNSVLDQEMPRSTYEIVFVDNGSSGNSAQYVLENFPSVRVLKFKKNYGFAEGNNRAAMYAQGEYFVFLNQDVVVHRQWLSQLVGVMRARPDVKACYSNLIAPWCPDFSRKERYAMPAYLSVLELTRSSVAEYKLVALTEKPIRTLFLSGSSVLVSRDVLEELGYLFDPDFFSYAEDLDLALRINSLGYKTVLVPTSVVYHDQTVPTSLTLSTLRKINLHLKNKFIAFFKNMHNAEFILYLPFILLGTPFSACVFKMGRVKTFAYFVGLIPWVWFSFFFALVEAPRYVNKRREILAKRRREGLWFLKRLVRGDIGTVDP
jgi:GT2 family glycosyltransferase